MTFLHQDGRLRGHQLGRRVDGDVDAVVDERRLESDVQFVVGAVETDVDGQGPLFLFPGALPRVHLGQPEPGQHQVDDHQWNGERHPGGEVDSGHRRKNLRDIFFKGTS